MNTKYTPAPWQVNKIPGGKSFAIDDLKSDEHVATAWGKEHDSEANAHLIAAAPDLLEALKAFVAVGDALGSDGVFIQEMKAARKAIAKAGGVRS